MYEFLEHFAKEAFEKQEYLSLSDSLLDSAAKSRYPSQTTDDFVFDLDGHMVKAIDLFREEKLEKLDEESPNTSRQLYSQPPQFQFPAKRTVPTPIVPGNIFNTTLQWTDVEPVELARQLTLRDFDSFKHIILKEYDDWIKHTQSKDMESRERDCPHLSEFITIGELSTTFFVSSILCEAFIKVRKVVLSKVVVLALELYNLNNFFGARYVTNAILHPAISRLEHTKSEIDKKLWDQFEKLVGDIDPKDEFGSFRVHVSDIVRAGIPIVPDVALCMNEMKIIDEEMNYVKDAIFNDCKRQLINWKKCKRKVFKALELLHVSLNPFSLQKIFQFQQLIKKEKLLRENYPLERLMKDSYAREGTNSRKKDIL